jgi:transcriptional regulator with XRE-family HTH domain
MRRNSAELCRMEDVLRNIKSLRLKRNWSQEAMAEELGMSRRMYNAYEMGNSVMTIETLEKVAKVLKVPIPVLYEKDSLMYPDASLQSGVANEESGDYKKTTKGKKIMIELDLSDNSHMMVFKQYLGTQYSVSNS